MGLTSSQMADESRPTQKTQPKGKDKRTGKVHDPIEIPVPKRRDVDGLLDRAAKVKPQK